MSLNPRRFDLTQVVRFLQAIPPQMVTRARVKKVMQIETILLSWTGLNHQVIQLLN
jgi:hypothetical protein